MEFYEAHQDAFAEMARSSYLYAAGYVEETGLPVRADDVAKVLVPALKTNEPLRECLAAKKLRTQNWYTFFADLILVKNWEDLIS
ncbi:MAG TPA: hypothetical protein VGG38_12240 [Acidimicrobiales bacterium]